MDEQQINLTDIEKIPLASEEFVKNFGKTLVVAPHPDDESLGCGGAIALLRKYGLAVSILVLSDGTLSHPDSQKYPKDKLRVLREKETLKAAEILDVMSENVTFFRYRDRSVPNRSSDDFAKAVGRFRKFLEAKKSETIFVPWRRDPHTDHRAAFQIVDAAKTENQKIFEYPIWLYELAESVDAPLEREVSVFRLDITSAVEKKQKAISAHRSQTTNLIDDDPKGFRFSAEVLKNFAVPYEIYFRVNLR